MTYNPTSTSFRWLAMTAALAVCWAAEPALGGDGPTTRPLAGRLVCVGASETEGALASKPELCYVSRLGGLARAAHDDLQVINEGRSGWSTGAYAYNAAKLAEKLPADTTVITIMLGTNDIRDKGTPDKIATAAARNMERLIKAYQARVPHARVVILTPTAVYPNKFIQHLRDTGYDETGPAKLVAIDAAYKALAGKLGLQLIDLSDLPDIAGCAEGVHANDQGHAKIAERVWRELNDGNAAGPTTRAAGDVDETGARPRLTFDRPDLQATIAAVYADALANLLDKNTLRPAKPGDQNRLGRLADPPGTFIRAGGGYDQPWTRDASLNSWFAGSLLEPAVARNTLWAVCQRRGDGTVVVQQDNQWWDQCIWVVGAWNHYAVTGDRAFLADAYPVATATLATLRQDHFNSQYGLYMGPAFFADGIAAYPPPEYDPSNHSSFVLDHRHTRELMVLSTNCIYRQAYRCAARMAREVGRPAAEAADLDRQSDALRAAINQHLWSPQRQAYAYFLSGAGPDAGQLFFATEGSGQSFAILFDVADGDRAATLVRQMHVEPKGIVTLWPNLPQFDDQHLGRHNVMIWPLVNGPWATAAAKAGATDAYAAEVTHIADLVLASHGNFYEIYNPRTGQPDGGWQTGGHWGPVPNQTWSATANIAAVHRGLFGMTFEPDGLHLAPSLPTGWGPVALADVRYRQMKLSISLGGRGTRVRSVTLDGAELPSRTVPPSLSGHHVVVVELGDRR
jgi:lysophospholipase L1-like esterase